jgi:hypothetical protein
MNRRMVTGLALGLLFAAFGIISILVIVTKRHPFMVDKKLRLGAMILTLSALTTGCRSVGPEITCYDPMPPNQIYIDQDDSLLDTITISLAANDTITGKIDLRAGELFSYIIADSSSGSVVIKNNLLPTDGTFDEQTEEFAISITPPMIPGQYLLRFYATSKDSIKQDDWDIRTFTLKVTE